MEGGGASSPSFLGGFGAGVWHSQFGLLFNKLSQFGWPTVGDGLLPGFFVGATRRPGYVKKVKLDWRWMILNSLFRFCIWHTGRLSSVVYSALKS